MNSHTPAILGRGQCRVGAAGGPYRGQAPGSPSLVQPHPVGSWLETLLPKQCNDCLNYLKSSSCRQSHKCVPRTTWVSHSSSVVIILAMAFYTHTHTRVNSGTRQPSQKKCLCFFFVCVLVVKTVRS